MSRSYCSYDEDWQRRKSILIRSLFHDLPILSPVTEESDDSFHPVRPYEPFEDPPRPYSPLPPLIIERVPKINKHDEPEEHYKKLLIKIKRIYRRLFILNRNLSSDEECFSDKSVINEGFGLHSPLVINNDDLDNPIINTANDPANEAEVTNDLNDDQSESNAIDDNINDDQSDINDYTNSNNENVRQSTNSNVSNGYRADSESVETVIVDVLNYTKSSNGEASKDEKEQSNRDSESTEDVNLNKTDDERNSDQEASYNKSPRTNERSNGEESIVEDQSNIIETGDQKIDTNTRLIPIRTAQSIIDAIEELNDQEMSGEQFDHNQSYEGKSSQGTHQENPHREELVDIISEEELIDQDIAENVNNDDKSITNQYSNNNTERNNQNNSQKEITNAVSKQRNRFEDLNKSRMNINVADEGESDNSSVSDEEWIGEEESESLKRNSKELSTSALEEIENAQEFGVEEERMAVVPAEMMDDDEGEALSDIGSYYRQITTAALVHVDAIEDVPEIESQVYEDSPKSVILPVRRIKRTAAQAMLGRREELVEVRGNKESRASSSTDNSGASFEILEEMRSQKRKLSQASEPEIIHKSISEENNEFNRPSHDFTDVTSSPQNGGNFNISEHRYSNDFVEVLARILNESEINNENINLTDATSSPQNDGNVNISEHKRSNDLDDVLARILNENENNYENINLCRKRKIFEDVSIQTNGNVSWNDIRNELFVGTPKILRLCTCVDHICQ